MTILLITDFRDALFKLLNGSPSLDGKVYKHVPKETTTPYIVLGKLSRRQGDTIGTENYEVTQSIEIYDEAENTENIDNMLLAVDGLLDTLTMAARDVVLMEVSVDDSDFQDASRPYTTMTARYYLENNSEE